jgi:murein L,D-transpeptidase YafK
MGNAIDRHTDQSAMKRATLVSLALALTLVGVPLWAHWPRLPLPQGTRADRIVVHKGSRTLELYRGSELLRSYRVALGPHPVGGKQREGDGRTPEGRYIIDYRNPQSAFHKALHVSYPSAREAAAAYRRGVSPGGLIMVHGLRNGWEALGRLGLVRDWTAGCIAVTDRDIDEIWRTVPDGTPILIEP